MRRLLSFPVPSFVLATGLCVLATAASIGAQRLLNATVPGQPGEVLLLGDSEIDNYRLAEGDRIEDQLQSLLPGHRVSNYAQAGAFMADYYLRYQQALMYGHRPEWVLCFLSPGKLQMDAALELRGGKPEPMQVNPELGNLRWLPLDALDGGFWQTLSAQEKESAVFLKSAFALTGFYEPLEARWVDNVAAPRRRRQMLEGSGGRQQLIAADAAITSSAWSRSGFRLDDAGFARLHGLRHLGLIQDAVVADGRKFLVVLLPLGNPQLLNYHFSAAALENLGRSRDQLKRWLRTQGVPFVEISQDEVSRFPPAAWDDLHHFKLGEPTKYVSERIVDHLARNVPRSHEAGQ